MYAPIERVLLGFDVRDPFEVIYYSTPDRAGRVSAASASLLSKVFEEGRAEMSESALPAVVGIRLCISERWMCERDGGFLRPLFRQHVCRLGWSSRVGRTGIRC